MPKRAKTNRTKAKERPAIAGPTGAAEAERVPLSKAKSAQPIRLRGVRVHNLQNIDCDIPRHKLVSICGLSGSGKTSLALDTLYAEGQRRYIESFSAYTRQFLERLDKPDCDSVDGIPPAIAVTRSNGSRGNRSTVATATETADFLRLLFAKTAQLRCHQCNSVVRAYGPQQIAKAVGKLPGNARVMIGFPVWLPNRKDASEILADLQTLGFVRLILADSTFRLADDNRSELADSIDKDAGAEAIMIVDRLTGDAEASRITESIETAFAEGEGRVVLLASTPDDRTAWPNELPELSSLPPREVDQRTWVECRLSRELRCNHCAIDYPSPIPRLFSFNHPLGACPECEGFGDVMELDMKLIVPDASKTLREGAIACWNTPAYRHELTELLTIADAYDIPVDVPFAELPPHALEFIRDGVPERDFGGLRGFFAWLERKKYKMHVRIFLSRWRSYRTCPSCNGQRFKDEVLCFRVGDRNISEWMALEVEQALLAIQDITFAKREAEIARELVEQITNRLRYLEAVGLSYLQLERPLRTLSGGESQRVALTGALGSSLVNMLYVLDEPTAGLHPHDVNRLCEAIVALRDRGNTVVAVEHDDAIIRRSNEVIEIGPGAGVAGGKIVFQGSVPELLQSEESLTGAFLTGRRGHSGAGNARRKPRGHIELRGASGNNLDNIDVAFPLGVLCLVTGVSGSGKSTLIRQTLFPAICKQKRKSASEALPFRDLVGAGQIEDVMLIDQSPISRSPRSNPVTYIKAFDAIRAEFASSVDAKTRGFTPGHFSFNSAKGRCEQCEGDGVLSIDMQFLADITMQCPSCHGTRYRSEILQVRYRDRNIAECLQMTVRQAIHFFRGNQKLQAKLQKLVDVGLEYVGLGQSATTLSSGEAQRLKLAGFLAGAKRRRTLFILDEPTTGLHFADIVKLIDCFDTLIADGHSLIVVEHNAQLMRSADHIIDLGPGASSEGGRIVAQGTPEEIAKVEASKTGQVLIHGAR